MKLGLGNAVAGLPALIGVVLGIRAYTSGLPGIVVCVALFGVALLGRQFGRAVLHQWPKTGAWLIEVWILAAIGVMGLATALITWMGLATRPDWLLGVAGTDDARKAISGAFVGAATAYVALVWTKDIGDAGGQFWPSTQLHDAMEAAYENMSIKPSADNPAQLQTFEAIFRDSVVGHGQLGWGFKARRVRADILFRFVSTH